MLNKVTEISELYPFDIFKPEYLKVLMHQNSEEKFRVRVYLVTAQNLTASGVVFDLKSLLAGVTGLSTANPYPVISVGDGVNNNERRILKKHNDREKVIKGELNPKFFR